jgi:hypothetical protein
VACAVPTGFGSVANRTTHAFQLPPGKTVEQVYAEELERIRYT